MVFDERVKFLGSLVEMGIYRVSGILINDYGWVRDVKNALKDLVLFGKTKSWRTEGGGGRMKGDAGGAQKIPEGKYMNISMPLLITENCHLIPFS